MAPSNSDSIEDRIDFEEDRIVFRLLFKIMDLQARSRWPVDLAAEKGRRPEEKRRGQRRVALVKKKKKGTEVSVLGKSRLSMRRGGAARKIYVVCGVGFLVHCPSLSETLLPRCEHLSKR